MKRKQAFRPDPRIIATILVIIPLFFYIVTATEPYYYFETECENVSVPYTTEICENGECFNETEYVEEMKCEKVVKSGTKYKYDIANIEMPV